MRQRGASRLERRDRSSSTVRAYLSNLPRNTPRKALVYLLKERWRLEETFCDGRDPHFGLGLCLVRIAHPHRRDRLLEHCNRNRVRVQPALCQAVFAVL